jgi:hypothetical protein
MAIACPRSRGRGGSSEVTPNLVLGSIQKSSEFRNRHSARMPIHEKQAIGPVQRLRFDGARS